MDLKEGICVYLADLKYQGMKFAYLDDVIRFIKSEYYFLPSYTDFANILHALSQLAHDGLISYDGNVLENIKIHILF
jgi:hypothetical protein